MDQVVGNISLDDEAMHDVTDEGAFNESALLTMFDVHGRQGGFMRIGNRPNEGHAEMTFCWFQPDATLSFAFERATIEDNHAFEAGGLRIDLVAPAERLHVHFEGAEVARLASSRDLTGGGKALKAAPKQRVTFDAELTGLGPIYGMQPFPGKDSGGHFEQHMRIDGTISVDGAETPVSLFGNRDHSWGPRVWQSTFCDRTIWCTFGPELGFATSLTWKTPDAPKEVIGYVMRDGELSRVVDADIHSTYSDEAELWHETLELELRTEDGRTLRTTGTLLDMAPLRSRRDGLATHIGWGMSRFECEGVVGAGLSEYLDTRTDV